MNIDFGLEKKKSCKNTAIKTSEWGAWKEGLGGSALSGGALFLFQTSYM